MSAARWETKVCSKCGKTFTKMEGGIVRDPMSFQPPVCPKCEQNSASKLLKNLFGRR